MKLITRPVRDDHAGDERDERGPASPLCARGQKPDAMPPRIIAAYYKRTHRRMCILSDVDFCGSRSPTRKLNLRLGKFEHVAAAPRKQTGHIGVVKVDTVR